MLLVSFVAGLLVLLFSKNMAMLNVLLMARVGALAGTATELFSSSEYDTVTVPAVILAVLLALEML